VFILVYLSRDLGVANGFPLMMLPLILLAGYWENLRGALVMTALATGLIAAAHGLGWLPRAQAAVDILSCGLLFGLVVLIIQAYDHWQKQEAALRLPQEAKLIRVERKARLIHGQIEEYERRLKILTHLYEAAKKLMGILDLSTLMDEARTLVGKIFSGHFGVATEADACVAFYLPEEESGEFKRFASQGHEISDEGFPEKFSPGVLRGWLGEAFSPLRIRDVHRDVRFKTVFSDTAVSVLIIPLVMHEILIGLLIISSSRENAFSAAEFNHTAVLGKQIVFALRKAFLYRKVQTLSITDNLTGLYVHRHFQERLREELHRAERYRHFLSMILVDLDHFKRVNDNYGHPTGDAVLSEVAARLRRSAGSTAVVARYGGEEFVILLPNAPKAKALQIASLIHEVVRATPILVAGTPLAVTLSAGVSTYPEDALTQDTLITTSDAALYQAKRSGRDMVVGYTRMIKEKNI
jgi:diguanylate cyclase (GGDEF)-like protein